MAVKPNLALIHKAWYRIRHTYLVLGRQYGGALAILFLYCITDYFQFIPRLQVQLGFD